MSGSRRMSIAAVRVAVIVLVLFTTSISLAQNGQLDYTLTPNSGSATLDAGFQPDPFTVSITSGGPINASYLGDDCRGYAIAAPDFRIFYTAGRSSLLRFFFVGDGDTTLIVNGPDATWHCNDDSFGSLNPTVDFDNPQSGQYDIWVGSFQQGSFIRGTLFVTQESGNTPVDGPTPPVTEAQYVLCNPDQPDPDYFVPISSLEEIYREAMTFNGMPGVEVRLNYSPNPEFDLYVRGIDTDVIDNFMDTSRICLEVVPGATAAAANPDEEGGSDDYEIFADSSALELTIDGPDVSEEGDQAVLFYLDPTVARPGTCGANPSQLTVNNTLRQYSISGTVAQTGGRVFVYRMRRTSTTSSWSTLPALSSNAPGIDYSTSSSTRYYWSLSVQYRVPTGQAAQCDTFSVSGSWNCNNQQQCWHVGSNPY